MMASDTNVEAAARGEADVEVEEYESDPDEVIRSLVMRRREASDEEEEERVPGRGMNRRSHIHSDDESDGQGGAPAEYDNEEEEEEHDGELVDDDEERDVYEDEEGEEVCEEEARIDGEVKIKQVEGNDAGRSVEGLVELSAGNNENGNDAAEEGSEEEKKESNEPFAVPTAGAFYMHDDRFREFVGGKHRRTHGGHKLWESKDERKWGHDKFEEMTVQERHYDEGRRTSRGRYRGRGKNYVSDQVYPRGSMSKAFNNNNTNNSQNQAPKGIRGRGPRKYNPAWKNSNQERPPQNQQLGKPLEKTSHSCSGSVFTSTSNSESDTAPTRKQVFASSLNSASPPFYPSSSSDVNSIQKKNVQSGNTSRNIQNSGADESFTVQQHGAVQRGKNVPDVSMEKLYIGDPSSSSPLIPLNNLQVPPASQSRSQGQALPQQKKFQPAPPHNQANRGSPAQFQTVQRNPRQNRARTSAQSPTQQLGQPLASGSQTSSPPKESSAIRTIDSEEVESSSESSKLKSALVGMGRGAQGRGSLIYSGAQVLGAPGNMSISHGDQNFQTFLPVMQFAGQHPGGIGVPALGMAFPGYVGQPQHGSGNSEMKWLPFLAGAAGALGASYCPPYISVDNAYNTLPAGQTSAIGSSSKEISANKSGSEWKSSQRPESGNGEIVRQQNKPQPRRYSAMNLANDVLR